MNEPLQQYLNILYQNNRGNGVPTRHREITETYGEILYPSITKLLSAITLTADDVFFDLGSGMGKVVVQVFLTSMVKEANGIEIIPELHQQAVWVAQRVQHDFPHLYQERKLFFQRGNFLETSFQTATIILIGSPCFSPKILYALEKLINNSPCIHTVLTLRPLFHLKDLIFKNVIRVECSWDTTLCYLYERAI